CLRPTYGDENPGATFHRNFSIVHDGTGEAAFERVFQDCFRELERKPLEVHQIDGVGDHIAWLAAAKLLARRPVVLFDEALEQRHWTLQALRRAEALENVDEFLCGRAPEKHLVLDAPHKRFIPQL